MSVSAREDVSPHTTLVIALPLSEEHLPMRGSAMDEYLTEELQTETFNLQYRECKNTCV